MQSRLLLFGILSLAAAGCAFQNPDNTPLLALLDQNVHPKAVSEQVALGVVFVPVSVTAALTDIVIVHPGHCLALAGEDAWYIVWAEPGGTFVEQSLVFVPKAAVTPVVYAFCWLGRSLFDIPRRVGGKMPQ